LEQLGAMDEYAHMREMRRKDREVRKKDIAEMRKASEVREQDRRREEEAWRQWRKESELDAARNQQEQREKRARDVERQKRISMEQLEQHKATVQHRQRQRDAEQRADQETATAARELCRHFEEVEERRRQTQRDVAVQLRVAADEAHKRKARALELEARANVELAQAHEQWFARQAEVHSKAVEDVRRKQAKGTLQKELGNIVAEKLRKAKEDDERTRRQQSEQAQRDRQLREFKAQQQQMLQKAAKADLQKQIEENEEQRRQRREEHIQACQQERREAQAALAFEVHAEEEKRKARVAHANCLLQQIGEKSGRATERLARDQMNDLERTLNSKRLARAMDATRPDGLQMLFNRKRAEYLAASVRTR